MTGSKEAVYLSRMDSPVGRLTLASTEKGLVYLCFPGREGIMKRWLARRVPGARPVEGRSANRTAEQQLRAYFQGRRKGFDLTLDVRGTPFQKAVWRALSAIPWGRTSSYGAVARKVKRPHAARAVGAAAGSNPLSLVIPCHRVVGADGGLVGFGGGLRAKEILLKLEGTRPLRGGRP